MDNKDLKIQELIKIWQDLTPNYRLNKNGINRIKTLFRKYDFIDIKNAMEIASEQYIIFDNDDKPTLESYENAINKIGGICHVNSQGEEVKRLFYIKGIIRNRLTHYYNDAETDRLLTVAESWGVNNKELEEIACHVTSWTKFNEEMYNIIQLYKKEQNAT